MRPANVYFLVICLLQTWNEVTITSGRPTMALPFAFRIRHQQGTIEDAAKHKADNIQNRAPSMCTTPRPSSGWRGSGTWVIGQVLKILNKSIPADIVVVGSSDQENNGVFINTKSLDGETTSRSRCPMTSSAFTDDLAFAAKVGGDHLPAPLSSASLRRYTPARGQAGAGKKMPLSLNNCIFRGCQIKQTECIGVSRFFSRCNEMFHMAAHLLRPVFAHAITPDTHTHTHTHTPSLSTGDCLHRP